MTTPDFNAAWEAYKVANGKLLRLIDNPVKDAPINEYQSRLKQAQKASSDAHKKMMEAWE